MQLKQDSALAYPQIGEPYIVQLASTDAATGAILIQDQDEK